MAALRRYQILDTPQDGAFDGITALVAKFLDVPIAIASLVDEDRIWFKSHHGLDVEQVDKVPGLCASAILGDVPYIINEADKDPRSLANPLVAGELGLRFYAAAPLKTHDGHKLGTLCAIDVKPRAVSDEDIEILSTLARVIMNEMELRLAAREIARKNDELKNLVEEKNRFMGMAAHDLRSPLGVILSFAELLESEIGPALSDEHEKFLKIIKETSEFMIDLVDDLLDITSVEAGQLRLERKPVDLAGLIRNNVQRNALLGKRKQVAVIFENSPSLPEIVLDPSKLQQVLNNLINNAIKFSYPQTTVRIGVQPAEDFVTVSVADEGQGIPEAELEKIFQPFSSASVHATQGERSTGLGLAIVKRIVEGHGGRIWVKSLVSQGSTFSFTLPVTEIL